MKNYFKIYLCNILLMLMVLPVQAFDLVTAYQSALSYNADYLAAIAKNQAAQELKTQATATLLPQLSGSAGVNEVYLNAGMNLYYHQMVANAQLQQIVFDFGKFSQYTKGKFAVETADLQLVNAKEQLIVQIAQAYFDVLYANDVLDAIRIKKTSLAKQLEQAQHSFDMGTVTIADVNDAKSGFDLALAQEIQSENDLINRKNILHNLTGLNSDLIQPLIQNINLVSPTPESVEQWVVLAKTGNLNNKIASLQLKMAREDISIAKAGHMPTINLIGNYQYQGGPVVDGADAAANNYINGSSNVPGSFLSSFAGAGLGLQVNVPIFSGGGISSKVRQAIDVYEGAQQQLVTTMRQTNVNVESAFYRVQNGMEIVKAQTQALKSAKLKLNSDQIGYQVGVRNSVNLVNSETNYSQTIQNYNQARYQYLFAELQLKYLIGDIDLDYLQSINQNIAQ